MVYTRARTTQNRKTGALELLEKLFGSYREFFGELWAIDGELWEIVGELWAIPVHQADKKSFQPKAKIFEFCKTNRNA